MHINHFLILYKPYVLTTGIVKPVSYRLTPTGFRCRKVSVLGWKNIRGIAPGGVVCVPSQAPMPVIFLCFLYSRLQPAHHIFRSASQIKCMSQGVICLVKNLLEGIRPEVSAPSPDTVNGPFLIDA